MNSDTVFSLLSEEVEHSSNSTMRMSTRLSMLKVLDTPRWAESGPPRKRDSSSPILLSMGVTDPGAAGTGPVSSPLVPITDSSMRWRQRVKSHFHVTFNQSLVPFSICASLFNPFYFTIETLLLIVGITFLKLHF